MSRRGRGIGTRDVTRDRSGPVSDYLLNAFVTLFVTVDPPGLAPIFVALTARMTTEERRAVAWRSTVIAALVLLFFAVAGGRVLGALGISIPAFRIAGGLLLFYIAFEMVFARRSERKSESAGRALTGLLGLVLRRSWPGWSLALGRSGLFFWLTSLPMSLWVMQLFWGGFFFDEPRWRVPFTFAVVGVLLQAGLWVLNAPPLLTCLGNLGFGAALWWNTLTAEAILHPESPVFQSNSPRIQVFFAALVLLSLLFGAQLAALLHSRQS